MPVQLKDNDENIDDGYENNLALKSMQSTPLYIAGSYCHLCT